MMRWNTLTMAIALIAATTLGMTATAAESESYLVVFEKGASSDLQRTEMLQQLGGELVRYHPEIGVALVKSQQPRFADLVWQAKGVQGVSPVVKEATSWSGRNATNREAGIYDVQGLSDIRRDLDADPAAKPIANAEANRSHGGGGDPIPDPTQTEFWDRQWNMRVIGMEELYDRGIYGDPRVKVAVIGAGLDYLHEDLVGRVDLNLSKSFVPSDDALVEELFPGAHPIADLGFHTTNVASHIACTVTNMACIAPRATLVGVKVLDLNETGTIADLVAGIVYAANIRSNVIVIPFAYWGPENPAWDRVWNRNNPEDVPEIIATRLAIAYAKLRGSVVIAESSVGFFEFGRDWDTVSGGDVILPAQAGATTAGASSREDFWAIISNYGFSLVDLVGPGGRVFPDQPPDPQEFIFGACSGFSQFGILRTSCARENQPRFVVLLGPQMASAHVAGVAAQISSRFRGRIHGFFVDYILRRTAVDIEDPGIDALTGHGRVDAFRAVNFP